ncbi:ATP-binding protein [Hymenobacter sp. H14-R3]|uniref:ATP-binding protein n=1 Tax=Hymenobacter sp. H14-R3 TaxID=3046308 RepID=UPI0024B97427|nr:ATP-binding protein [Hymenobacter sp. H14-R3]MDJ0364068.1 ATP-binding protein [Hymenobacter sp. H14-R3]
MSLPDERLLDQAITLTNCDREPIHIPGAIQPYGFLLCLDESTRRVVYVSDNTADLLGVDPASLLGAGLGRLLAPARMAEVEACLATLTATHQLLGVRLDLVAGQPFYKLIMHRHDQLLWLEFEPVAESGPATLDLPLLNAALGHMLTAGSVADFCQQAVAQVRALTSFDRVAIYRFAPDESGEVVAEATRPGLAPWLGLRYPASDIPQQARSMYLLNWLRFIPDASYVPARLVALPVGRPSRPPDMTYAVLRSVSPIHIQYLHNLGSAATMTLSLIQDGQLWGMITCHHLTPWLVSYELRKLCQFIAKTFSALLGSKQQQDALGYQLRLRERQARLFTHLSHTPNFVEGLYKHAPTLADVLDCGGAAICFDGELVMLGNTPSRPQLEELLAWLQAHARQDVFHTNSYASLNPAGLAIRGTASGILAAALSEAPGNYLLWFRPELVQTVTWAGQHEKVQQLASGELFMSPRQSFEAWKQLVENTALPWQPLELAAAQEIRLHISDVRLKVFNELHARARALQHLNTQLARSNEELDSFAYVASHDLKEPLRGIHNYSLFLLEDYADQLDADGVSKLQTLVRLSQRMEGLIEGLLQLARVGSIELVFKEVDMNEVVAGVLDLLHPRLEQTQTTVAVPGPLPTVLGEYVWLQEIVSNLLTNSIKYSEQPAKAVTIGVVGSGVVVPGGPANSADFHIFYVRDYGIGIAPRHHEKIFKLFKRLHAQEKYGGGTGAGLAIAKKMVEKQGGSLWVASELGQGATFYFSLPRQLPVL